MLIEERLYKIEEVLKEKKSATIDFLSKSLSVSRDTIRRDLIKLEEKNIIKRTYGGAVLLSKEALVFDYNERLSQLQEVKEKIGRRTAELIKNNSYILFDSSTTVQTTIPFLDNYGIHGITNSLTSAQLLGKLNDSEITVLPGRLNKEQLFLYGADTVKKINKYFVDYTILGVFAINSDGLYVHTEEEGAVKTEMVKNGKQVIALADHTKLDTIGFFKVCDLKEIDVLITDTDPSQELKKSLEDADVRIIIAD